MMTNLHNRCIGGKFTGKTSIDNRSSRLLERNWNHLLKMLNRITRNYLCRHNERLRRIHGKKNRENPTSDFKEGLGRCLGEKAKILIDLKIVLEKLRFFLNCIRRNSIQLSNITYIS